MGVVVFVTLSGLNSDLMMLFSCCNKEDEDEDPQDDGAIETPPEQNISHSLNKMFYNRIGKVEKFKHGSTVMFLGKALVLSLLILLLVQFIANTETCYLETEINKLPTDVQKILMDRSNVNSLRCPYNDKLDVAYTFNLVTRDQNETNSQNVTAIKVDIADIVAKKHYSGSDEETVLQTCGRLCSVKSCKCFEKMIWSSSCYIDFYEYGLQVDSIDVEPKKGVFSIYFVVMVFILILLTASFALYKIIINCGRKQATTSVSI